MQLLYNSGFDSERFPGTVDLVGFVLTDRGAVYGQHSEAKASIRMIRMDSATTLVSFALTKQPARDGREAIILHLYRDIVPVVTRTIAIVEPSKAASLLSKCRRHLETLGVESIAHSVYKQPELFANSLGQINIAN